jgi:type I restriction enzyme M protein
MSKNGQVKSLESWIWDAACSIRGAKDAPKFKDYILPLIFLKRLCDVYDDEINRIAKNVGNRIKAFELVERDRKLVRFYLPFKPSDLEKEEVWSVVRKLSSKIGEQLTSAMRDVARENPSLSGIIDRVDFNATTHGQRDIDDDRLSNLIERISEKRLGLKDVEPDIIGRSYEYLIRKFAENSGKSAGEFYTPAEVGMIMAKIMSPEPGMEIYDPTCGSAGLLIKCQMVLDEKYADKKDKKDLAPLKLFGQEYISDTWAMAKMNMIVHDMEGDIEIGDTMRYPKLLHHGRVKEFDRVVANPMWNQGRDELPYLNDEFFSNDPYNRFRKNPGGNADWAWMQHIYSSLKGDGRSATVLDTGAASRGSGNANTNREKEARAFFIDEDLIEGVIYLPDNLFYNTSAPGVIVFLNKNKKHEGRIFLINAAKEFVKGDPKNYIPDESIEKIAKTFNNFEEVEGFSKFITKEEAVKNDYNISPSRYIHVGGVEEYRPVDELVEELKALEVEGKEIDKELWKVLGKLGYE